MSIFEYDAERELRLMWEDSEECGLRKGIAQGIQAFILDNLEEGISSERILEKLERRFELSKEQALNYFNEYKNS